MGALTNRQFSGIPRGGFERFGILHLKTRSGEVVFAFDEIRELEMKLGGSDLTDRKEKVFRQLLDW